MKLVICLPGKSYSGAFLANWTEFVGRLLNDKISISISQRYSPNIYYARNLCLDGDIRRGTNQLPFNGQLDYDYILWNDSDNIPTYDNFNQLLSRNVDICAGIYKMTDGRYATVKNWDTTYLLTNGEMEFYEPKEFEDVAYTGMGFMLIKRGVFEKLTYPWFQPLPIDLGKVQDFSTEDIYFCQKVQQLGFKVYVDPLVKVGHEKNFII